MIHAYNDAKADLVLQSKQRDKFRVHSYMLKASSNVFRDMLETCQSPSSSDKPGEAILITYRSEAVNDLLDLMYVGKLKGDITWDRCKTLLSLIDRYDAPRLQSLVVLSLFDVLPQHSLDIFAVASQMRSLSLAKMSIRYFSAEMRSGGSLNSVSDLTSEVRLDFLIGLLTAVGHAIDGEKIDWKRAAEAFSLGPQK